MKNLLLCLPLFALPVFAQTVVTKPPVATSSSPGTIQPDNTTVVVNNGVLSAIGGGGGGCVTGGDVTGPCNNQTVVGLRGYPVTATVPQRGQLLSFDGVHYVPVNFQVPMYGSPATGSATLAFALSNTDTAPINIAIHGDSFNVANHQAGGQSSGPLLAANMWTERYRSDLQALFGSHGTGLYPVIYAAGAGGLEPLSWSCLGTWDNTSNLNLGPTQSGVGSLVYLAPGAYCTFNDHRGITYSAVSLYYATADNTNTLSLTADGSIAMGSATATNASASGVTHNGYTARRYDSATSLALTTHSIRVGNSGSTGAWLYGVEGIAQTGGAAVDNMGIGGARAEMFGSDATNQLAFDALIKGSLSGSIAMDMTNDLGNVSAATYQTNMQQWVTASKALPGSPSVMIAIPPVDIVGVTHPATDYLAAQRSICSSSGLQCPDAAALRGDAYVSTDFDQSGTTYPNGSGGVHYTDAVGRTIAQLVLAKTLNPQPPTASGGGCAIGCTFGGATTLNGGSNSVPLTVTSANAGGTFFMLTGSASGVDNWGFQSDAFGHMLVGDFTHGNYGFELSIANGGAGFMGLNNNTAFGWLAASVTPGVATPDTAFTRTAAGSVALGTGAAGAHDGTLSLHNVVTDLINGAVPSGGGSGCTVGCTFSGGTTLDGGSNSVPLTITSSSASGTFFRMNGTGPGVDDWGFQSDPFGQWLVGDFKNGQYGFEMRVGAATGGVVPGYMALGPGMLIGWRGTSVTTDGVGPDTAFARVTAGAVAPSNGSAGNISGVYSGPATAPSGACSVVGWQFTQDGHATFCNGSTWVSKI